MEFGLSEEQKLLQETVRSFVSKECPVTKLREIFDGELGTELALWKGLSEMGIAGLAISEDHGGAGMEVLDLALVSEVLGEGALPTPFLGHSLAGLAIEAGGSDEQKSRWLPRLASGDALGTVAFGELDNRWQPEEWTTQASGSRVTGTKRFVPNGSLSDVVVVGVAGGGLVLIEKEAKGVTCETMDGIDRTRGVCELILDEAPCESLPNGAAASRRVRDAALVLLAADSFGAAWKLIRMTIDYTGTREQFGTPLTQFQSVKHEIANMATDVEQTRAVYWYAAHALDHLPDDSAHAAAIAKAHITDRAMEAARSAFELHGGIGFTWECDVQMWFKRCMFNRAFLGTPEVHRERSAQLSGW